MTTIVTKMLIYSNYKYDTNGVLIMDFKLKKFCKLEKVLTDSFGGINGGQLNRDVEKFTYCLIMKSRE